MALPAQWPRLGAPVFALVLLAVWCAAPFALPAQEKLRIAVLDLAQQGAKQEAEAIAEELRKILVKSGKYVVIDRTLTAQILKEWETQQSGLTESEKAVKIGKLFNVQLIVTGKLNKFSSGGWQVSVVMLDAQSGITNKAETVRHRGDFFSLLDEKVPSLGGALVGTSTEEEFWKTIRDSNDKAMFQAFLKEYPKGRFAALARVNIKQLEKLSEAPRTAKLSQTPRLTPVQAPPGMVRIEGGEFQMGGDGEPVQRVRLSGFLIDENEVTQAAFQQAMGFNPSRDKAPNNPVEKVTWFQAEDYCKKIGKRLPTEAEWEYAARAGTTTKYFFGDYRSLLPNFANLCGWACRNPASPYAHIGGDRDSYIEVAPVKSLEPNPWGLYDVYGNVAEWVSDWYGYYGGGSTENPTGPPHGALKVLRGGSWSDSQNAFAPALRDKAQPGAGKPGIGFRCAADAQ